MGRVAAAGLWLLISLSLSLSQINLATRQKTKPRYNIRSLTTLHSSVPHFRPRSANFLQQRSRSSPFLGRPQSADPKFGRRLSVYFGEKELRHSKHVSRARVEKVSYLLSCLGSASCPRQICSSRCWRSPSNVAGCAAVPATLPPTISRIIRRNRSIAARASSWNAS